MINTDLKGNFFESTSAERENVNELKRKYGEILSFSLFIPFSELLQEKAFYSLYHFRFSYCLAKL